MGDLQFAKQFLTTLDAKNTKYKPDHVFDPKTFQTRFPYFLPKLPHPPHPLPPRTTPAAVPPPGAEPDITSPTNTITLILKSTRNPAMTLTLSSLPPGTTTIQSIKEQIQTHLGGSTGVPLEKIKILVNKKPIPASKRTVADALESPPEAGSSAEFGVMVMGGAPDPAPQSQPIHIQAAPAEPTPEAVAASAPESEKAAAEAAGTTVEAPIPDTMEGVEKTQSSDVPLQMSGMSGTESLLSTEFWDDLQGFLEQRIRDVEQSKKLRTTFEQAWRSSNSQP